MATFGLLHGAWHDPSCWEPVAERLEALGHSTTAPDLPLHDPAAGYEQRVRPAIEALEEADSLVVVVAHSQSSALGPLVAVARPVSLLVYLCPRMGSIEPPPVPRGRPIPPGPSGRHDGVGPRGRDRRDVSAATVRASARIGAASASDGDAAR